MSLGSAQLGTLSASRLILGGNPFSGFSHQGPQRDLEMRRYYTVARIKATLRAAEEAGITTFIGRVDAHIMRLLGEYWDEGGAIQWIAQTAPELRTTEMAVDRAVGAGARACFVHGGVTDHALANARLDELPPAIDYIRKAGLPAGIAGHDPGVFRWAEEHLDCDFYMCSYYNSAHRDQHAEHRSGMPEWFRPEDRQAMVELIRTIRRPVIHYKVLAAGRNDPAEGLGFAARHLRPGDAVCVGAYTGDRSGMLAEDVQLLQEALTRASA
ncbi:MAG: hypothetical protein ABIL09_14530 [Gemmatimonadota bacterium]